MARCRGCVFKGDQTTLFVMGLPERQGMKFPESGHMYKRGSMPRLYIQLQCGTVILPFSIATGVTLPDHNV